MQDPAARKQMIVFGALLAAICGALALGYFFFLRADYAVLASDLRPEDASAIVTELETRKTSYRIEDGGKTILVPAAQADATRVAIAGSDAAARGQIGFELFNKSDMGLTNFAQKINFQRALQGELVRTITALEGVENARVHLAIPERSLFRGERTAPSAAVTVTMKQGRMPDPARVSGIQRLVAAAVPDLPEAEVVVLDGQGRVISARAQIEAPGELDERQAVRAYYAARARSAIEPILGAGRFVIRVVVQALGETPALPMDAEQPDAGRDFSLRIQVVTPVQLNEMESSAVRDAVAKILEANPARGDSIELQTGPLTTNPVTAPSTAPSDAQLPTGLPSTQAFATAANATSWSPGWIWWVFIGLTMALVAVFLLRRRARLSNAEHDAFAARLQRQLAISQEAGDAQHG